MGNKFNLNTYCMILHNINNFLNVENRIITNKITCNYYTVIHTTIYYKYLIYIRSLLFIMSFRSYEAENIIESVKCFFLI